MQVESIIVPDIVDGIGAIETIAKFMDVEDRVAEDDEEQVNEYHHGYDKVDEVILMLCTHKVIPKGQ